MYTATFKMSIFFLPVKTEKRVKKEKKKKREKKRKEKKLKMKVTTENANSK